MLEARMPEAVTFKKVLDSIKELVTDANWDCNEDGISLQAMDNSHVALVAVHLNSEGFDNYRCDRNMPLGINLGSLSKVVKCAKDDDLITIKADDNADSLGLTFESSKTDRIGEYEIKLMDIDQEHLGIPDTQYDAIVSMPSGEFQRICRDLLTLGESVRIEASKEGVRFSAEGDIGNASVLLKQTAGRVKDEDDEEVNGDEEEEEQPAESEEEEEVKKEKGSHDEDEDEQPKKKRKSASNKASSSKGKKKAKKSETVDEGVSIILQQHVSLTFSLKYLNNFAKSTPLSSTVTLNMSNEVPLLVEYDFTKGHIRYYLAPKIDDDA